MSIIATRNMAASIFANLKETLHKARLTALHAICVQIFRHIAQKSLAIQQYACGISMQSAEKSGYASYAQALFSVSLKLHHPWKDASGNCRCESCGKVVPEQQLHWEKRLGYCETCFAEIRKYTPKKS